jgi:signal transduction histidine kinase
MPGKKTIFLAVFVIFSILCLQFTLLRQSIDSTNQAFQHLLTFRLEHIGMALQDSFYCYRTEAQLHVYSKKQFYFLYPSQHASGDTTLAHYDTLISNSKGNAFSFQLYKFATPTRINLSLDFEYLPLTVKKKEETYNAAERYVMERYKHYVYNAVGERLLDTVALSRMIENEIRSISGAEECQYRLYHQHHLIFQSAPNHAYTDSSAIRAPLYSSTLLPKLEIELFFPKKQLFLLSTQWMMIAATTGLALLLLLLFIKSHRLLDSLKRLNVLKSDFINLMTHEFNTPITNLKLTLNSFHDALPKEKKDKLLTIIHYETDRIRNNISTLFQINKLSVDELKLEKSQESMHDLLKMTAAVFEINFEEKNVETHWQLRATFDRVEVDKNHLLNVFTNIIDNAVKYASENPVLRISTENDSQYFVLRMQDNGIGMNKDQLDKAFDKYYRSNEIEVQATKGMGLGLFYSRKIIELHGGTIRLQSKLQQGTTIIIKLPRE